MARLAPRAAGHNPDLEGEWSSVPTELRDLVLRSARKDAVWAATYLDPCGLCVQTGVIHPATTYARSMIVQAGAEAIIEQSGYTLGEALGLGPLQRAKAKSTGERAA